jgi:predicted nucleic acid-binding protein
LLAAGQQVLGTSTKTGTVNAALHELLRFRAAADFLALTMGDAMSDRYLLDVSAVRRLAHHPAAERVAPLVAIGLVTTCAIVDLELFATLASPDAHAEASTVRARAFSWLPTNDSDLRRALAIQAELLAQDTIAPWPALIVAAVAEREHVTVVHYDDAFEQIAKVTGQPVERLP